MILLQQTFQAHESHDRGMNDHNPRTDWVSEDIHGSVGQQRNFWNRSRPPATSLWRRFWENPCST